MSKRILFAVWILLLVSVRGLGAEDSISVARIQKAFEEALLPSGQVFIQDDIEGIDRPVKVRWSMATSAKVAMKSYKRFILEEDGKRLEVRAISDTPIRAETYSTKPKADWDAPNPGTCMIGFEIELAVGQKTSLGVLMTPGVEESLELKLRPVLSWSGELKKVPDAVRGEK